MVRQVSSKTSVKIGVAGLKMSCQTTVLHGQIVVFLLVHLFVDDILLSDAQGTSRTSLVNFGSSTSGLDTCLETAVTPARRCNIGSLTCQRSPIIGGYILTYLS